MIVLNERISYSNDHKLEIAFRRFLRMLNESLYGRNHKKYHDGITAVAIVKAKSGCRLDILAVMEPRYRIRLERFEEFVRESWSKSEWQSGQATTRIGKPDWVDAELKVRPATLEQFLV
jgi:hypothetical protein